MPIQVEIVSKERKVFEEPAADMVLTTLGFGELVVRKGGAEERFAIYGGVVDVRPNKVTVLAEMAESSFALDLEAIEQARASAARLMAEGVPPEQNREAELALRRAELAVKITQRVRQRGQVMRIITDDDKA